MRKREKERNDQYTRQSLMNTLRSNMNEYRLKLLHFNTSTSREKIKIIKEEIKGKKKK